MIDHSVERPCDQYFVGAEPHPLMKGRYCATYGAPGIAKQRVRDDRGLIKDFLTAGEARGEAGVALCAAFNAARRRAGRAVKPRGETAEAARVFANFRE